MNGGSAGINSAELALTRGWRAGQGGGGAGGRERGAGGSGRVESQSGRRSAGTLPLRPVRY
eukprot:3028764-Rhodomonas_salina.1